MTAGAALRTARDQVFRAAGLNALARHRLDGRRAAILMYHRILPESEAQRLAVEPAMYVTPESFDDQLRALRHHGFEPTPLHTLCDDEEGSKPWPRRAVALTFDDGWRDNHSHAGPILERHGFTATVFVVTERVGTTGAFWPDEVARRLSALGKDAARHLVQDLLDSTPGDATPADALLVALKASTLVEREALLERLRSATPTPDRVERELMNWQELDELSAMGFDVESHGRTHELFDRLDDGALKHELEGSLDTLRSRGHGEHALLAYPSGALDTRVVNATREAGYTGAVTTHDGVATRSDDRLTLPRLGVHEAVGRPRARFLAKVPGWR